MIEDAELLRRYARDRAEDAFAELVRRRIGLVYSVALRQCGGDGQLAEEVTQRVFVDLAKKAATLANRPVLSGWLCKSTRFAASDVVRAERRRRAREEEARIMNEAASGAETPVDWDRVRPVIDAALAELSDADRDVVALRFFEERSFAEIGARLALAEDVARKRLDRALDKLHAQLMRRGVNSTTAALGVALGGQVAVAVPVGLASKIAGGVLVSSVVGLSVAGVIKLVGVGLTVAIFVVGGFWASTAWDNHHLWKKIAAEEARASTSQLMQAKIENHRLVQAMDEVLTLRRDDAELTRLRDEAARLNERMKWIHRRAEITDQNRDFVEPRSVTVAGQVRRPKSQIDLKNTGVLTLGRFIEWQGGLTPMGDSHHVKVTRVINGEVKVEILDLERGGDAFVLRADDIVYVGLKKL